MQHTNEQCEYANNPMNSIKRNNLNQTGFAVMLVQFELKIFLVDWLHFGFMFLFQ